MHKWRRSTWGDEVTLEYGKSLRNYSGTAGGYRVFGSNGPIGWTDRPLAEAPGLASSRPASSPPCATTFCRNFCLAKSVCATPIA